MEPESVKRLLANCNWNEGGKQRITEEVDRFYRYQGIKWDRPKYEKIDLLPPIPKEEDVDALVSGLSGHVGTFCLLLKETGCRSGEAWSAEWVHIDFERNAIIIRPEKGSRSRELRISNQLIARLHLLLDTNPLSHITSPLSRRLMRNLPNLSHIIQPNYGRNSCSPDEKTKSG